ncbi:MAG TPA: hypothetical protein VGP72_04360 [Planctomycetota bacterium]|jgi:antitoxin (DNA-binding transcriptional repressor) of toxin-antitoxin stability system
MRKTPVEGNDLLGIVDAAQREKVLLTRSGKPVAIVWGIQNKDAEDLFYESSPEFWKMIEERRREEGGVPLEQVETQIAVEEAKLARAKPKQRRGRATRRTGR